MERGQSWETESKVGRIEKEMQEELMNKVEGEQKRECDGKSRAMLQETLSCVGMMPSIKAPIPGSAFLGSVLELLSAPAESTGWVLSDPGSEGQQRLVQMLITFYERESSIIRADGYYVSMSEFKYGIPHGPGTRLLSPEKYVDNVDTYPFWHLGHYQMLCMWFELTEFQKGPA